MKFPKKTLWIGLFSFCSLVAFKVYADSYESVKLIGVVGTQQVVRFDRTILVADIDVTTIGTSGTDTYFMGTLEMGLFSSTGSNVLKVSSSDANSSKKFRLLKPGSTNDYIMLKITSDSTDAGVIASSPVDVVNEQVLRKQDSEFVEDEVQILTIYAIDDADNSTASGVYETTLNFGWFSST